MNVFNFPAKWDLSILHTRVSDSHWKSYNFIALLELSLLFVSRGSISISFMSSVICISSDLPVLTGLVIAIVLFISSLIYLFTKREREFITKISVLCCESLQFIASLWKIHHTRYTHAHEWYFAYSNVWNCISYKIFFCISLYIHFKMLLWVSLLFCLLILN